jgi:hypothetical protein
MAGPRRYTTKVRAKRIALQYFTRPHPFRRWKLILSIAAPAVGALWLLVHAALDDQRIYNGGPVSTAHVMFESECRLCHGPGPAPGVPVTQASLAAAAAAAPAGFFLPVSDAACTACHAGPDHNAKSDTPACGSCHVEHVGRAVLVQVADRHCVQCHGDLQTKDGTPPAFHGSVTAFARGKHPEFAVTAGAGDQVTRVRLDAKPEPTDATPIKLGHATHLKAGLKGTEDVVKQQGMAGIAKVTIKREGIADREGLQLTCTFCHRLDERGQYMKAIVYETHCAACHPLGFEGSDTVAPHETPAIVRAFIRGTLSEAYDRCQAVPGGKAGAEIRARCVDLGLIREPAGDAPRGRRRGGGETETPPSDAPRGLRRGASAEAETPPPDTPRGLRRGGGADAETPAPDAPRGLRRGGGAAAEAPPAPKGWVAEKMAAIEPTLFGKQGCGYCHTLEGDEPSSVDVVPPAIPARWLPHSRFDHAAHRPLACTECHGGATASEKTTDVLLPKLDTCGECHKPRAGARAVCVECHRYHDKTQERDPSGPFTTRQLRSQVGAPDRDRIR